MKLSVTFSARKIAMIFYIKNKDLFLNFRLKKMDVFSEEIFACSKLTIETLVKDPKYVSVIVFILAVNAT